MKAGGVIILYSNDTKEYELVYNYIGNRLIYIKQRNLRTNQVHYHSVIKLFYQMMLSEYTVAYSIPGYFNYYDTTEKLIVKNLVENLLCY